jgi:hypothetical protein
VEKSYTIGQAIVYVDPTGVRRPALVKCWWAQWPEGTETKYPDRARFPDLPDEVAEYYKALCQGEPGCNLVFVSADVERNDNCGRQTEIVTSAVHKSRQAAHGNYWCWADE